MPKYLITSELSVEVNALNPSAAQMELEEMVYNSIEEKTDIFTQDSADLNICEVTEV